MEEGGWIEEVEKVKGWMKKVNEGGGSGGVESTL